MEYLLKLLLCLICVVTNARTMSINGSALMRYDPCGLGVLYFDKVTDRLWLGVMNFDLYSNLANVEAEMSFGHEVSVFSDKNLAVFNNNSNKNRYKFIANISNVKKITFYVGLINNNNNDNSSNLPLVTEFQLNNITLCNSDIKTSMAVENLNVTENEVDDYHHLCGRKSLDHTELLSVRTEARAGDFPWHVAIFIMDFNTADEEYYCGGNIISRTAILTAGHCMRKGGKNIETNRIKIVAGVSDRDDLYQVGRQVQIAEEAILHPSYTDKLATADLAVIKVNRLEYTKYVQPICLWGPVYNKQKLFGIQAIVVGFGQTETNQPSKVLRSTYTVIQNDTTCLDFSANIYQELLNEFTFCAGYGPNSNINPRNGDSGGGLVLGVLQPDHRISLFLRGVLSKCGVSPRHTDCDPTFYVVYTDVSPYYGWVYHHSGLKFTVNIPS
ncbi:CLIP domain-containing serine protease B4-like [Plodia interpunctella]|uniref:CLIP domain-containing serine protease B4-like n=1 Tax=Plodia interpunctella TaxID=58824 RepID=UPI0023683E55|nr:CLIP domain-containing serine protease B4-like [Plodia interpunctella]